MALYNIVRMRVDSDRSIIETMQVGNTKIYEMALYDRYLNTKLELNFWSRF